MAHRKRAHQHLRRRGESRRVANRVAEGIVTAEMFAGDVAQRSIRIHGDVAEVPRRRADEREQIAVGVAVIGEDADGERGPVHRVPNVVARPRRAVAKNRDRVGAAPVVAKEQKSAGADGQKTSLAVRQQTARRAGPRHRHERSSVARIEAHGRDVLGESRADRFLAEDDVVRLKIESVHAHRGPENHHLKRVPGRRLRPLVDPPGDRVVFARRDLLHDRVAAAGDDFQIVPERTDARDGRLERFVGEVGVAGEIEVAIRTHIHRQHGIASEVGEREAEHAPCLHLVIGARLVAPQRIAAGRIHQKRGVDRAAPKEREGDEKTAM